MAESEPLYLAGLRMVQILIFRWSDNAAGNFFQSSSLFCNMIRHFNMLNLKTFHTFITIRDKPNTIDIHFQFSLELENFF
jgi:hypothetical protein